MPLFPPNTAYGRLGGSWRTWGTPWVHRSGSWEQPERVWVYSAGSWRIVWTQTATAALNPVATINGTSVDITWDAPAGTTGDPEVATSYNVRRSDGSLVGSVTAVGGSYLVTDAAPLVGTNAYTVLSAISGVQYVSVLTNTVTLGAAPTGIVATTSNVGIDTNVTVTWNASPGAQSYNIANVNGSYVGNTTSLTFTDTNPVASQFTPARGYLVTPVLSNGTGNPGTSNVLTLARPPTSLAAAAPVNGDDVALTWSVASVGVHDQIQVVRGGSSLVYLAAGSTSYTDTNARQGTVESYKVRAVISDNHGAYSNTATSAIPAKVPTSVTAAATATKGQLRLSWANPTGDSLNTGYQVQANNGTWVDVGDNVSPSYYTFTGSGSKSMRVRALSVGGSSAYVTASATPVWTYKPNVPRSVSAAATSTVGALTLTWSAPTNDASHDAPTSYQVQTSTNNSSWSNRGNQNSPYTYDFGESSSGARYMRVRATNSAGSSSYVTVSATPLWTYPPNVPASVSVAATSTVGQLKLSWSAPGTDSTHSAATSYQVQTSTNNSSWTNRGNQNSPYTYGFGSSGSGARYMRVRATNSVGSSSYVTKSGTPLWDTTPPTRPTITSWKPESSYGRMVIRFTASSSDNHQYEVNFRVNGGGWGFGNVWNSLANNQSIARELTVAPNAANKIEVRVRVRDQYLNTSAWTSTWQYTTEVSPIIVGANSSGHWRSGTYGANTTNPTRPYQGYYSNASYNYYGYFYYGTQIADRCNANGTVGGDKTVTNMRNYLIREGGGNNAADCVYLGTHTMTTNPGYVNGALAPLSNLGCQGTLTYGQGAWITLSTSARNALANGSQRGTGIAAPTGKPYMFLYPYTVQYSGWIEITHLG